LVLVSNITGQVLTRASIFLYEEPEQLLVYLIYLANAVWRRLNSCGEVQETSSAEL